MKAIILAVAHKRSVYLGVVGLLFLQSPVLFGFGFDGLIMLDISRRIHVHSGLIRFHLSVFPVEK